MEVGDTLPQVPKHRLGLMANAHPVDGLTVSLIGLYVSTQFYLNMKAMSSLGWQVISS